MTRRLLAFVLATSAALVATSDRVAACSCMGGLPACSRIASTPPTALFTGQVLDVAPASGGRVRVRMRLMESFLGSAAADIDIYTGPNDGGTCAYYPFVPGESYLVYARAGAAGQLSTGICTGTDRLERVPESDLAYLRGRLQQPEGLGTIQGTVTRRDPAPLTRSEVSVPFEGARIIAESKGERIETVSGADGRYTMTAPAGLYTITAEVPQGLYAGTPAPLTTDLADARGCAIADIWIKVDGRITGRLLDARGFPIAHMTVDALPAGGNDLRPFAPEHRAVTDLEGRYEIDRLPAGEYVIGIDTPFRENTSARQILLPGTTDPADAQRILVVPGARVAAADFRALDSLDLATITGMVRDAAGNPAENVQVLLSVGTGSSWPQVSRAVLTDAAGWFRITVPAGRRYRMRVEQPLERWRFRRVLVDPFDVSRDVPAFDITLPE